jgi:diphthine synthase
VGITGLQVYKFGKTTSIPFPEEKWHPETPYDVIKENKKIGLHTLVLLDLKPKEKRFMTVNDAIKYLLEIEGKRKDKVFTKNTICLGCARLGSEEQFIMYGKASELAKKDFGGPMHCLIIPGKLHFAEKEAIEIINETMFQK